jgi:hypothetical protein
VWASRPNAIDVGPLLRASPAQCVLGSDYSLNTTLRTARIGSTKVLCRFSHERPATSGSGLLEPRRLRRMLGVNDEVIASAVTFAVVYCVAASCFGHC